MPQALLRHAIWPPTATPSRLLVSIALVAAALAAALAAVLADVLAAAFAVSQARLGACMLRPHLRSRV